jgi:uncharacterized protein
MLSPLLRMVGRVRWLMLPAALLLAAAAWAEVAVPPLTARVTDLTGTLSASQRQALEQELAAFEQRKGVQIAVLLVPTTAPETIEQYSIRVVDQWRLGRKNVDDGLLLLIAKNDRTLRIEVGYGLEGVVPDAVANRVINEIIVPHFRAGDFAGGVQAGVSRLMGLIEGEPLPAPQQRERGPAPVGNLLPFLLFAFFILSGVFNRMLGRLAGATVTGGIMGGLFWLLAGSLGVAILVALLAFVMALLTAGGGGPGIFPGGFYGGRGGVGGGSGRGGFGGGGGGFGGGGASGRW